MLTQEGMPLGKTSVNRRLRELRQDPDNEIQINFKCITKIPKEKTKRYKIAERLVTYLPEYYNTWKAKPSVRTAFYDFQDFHLITRKDGALFNEITVHARLGWVDAEGNLLYPKIPIDAFSDSKDRSVTVGNYTIYPPIDPQPPESPSDYLNNLISNVEAAEGELETAQQTAEENLDEAKEDLLSGPDNYEGIGTRGRRGSRWYGQPEHVEIWEEKVDLADNFNNLLLVMVPLSQTTTLAVKLSGERTTVNSAELAYVMGHVIGQSDAKSGNMTNAHSCIRAFPDDRNFCVVWATGYAIGWKEITGQDIDLPPPFPQPEK